MLKLMLIEAGQGRAVTVTFSEVSPQDVEREIERDGAVRCGVVCRCLTSADISSGHIAFDRTLGNCWHVG